MIYFLLILAAFSNFIMDLIKYRWHNVPRFMKRNYQFWNPNYSWVNKWKKGLVHEKDGRTELYHWERGPRFGERFPGSSTIFVFLTDAWHLFKEVMISSLIVCIVLSSDGTFIDYLIYRSIFGITFEFFFRQKYGN